MIILLPPERLHLPQQRPGTFAEAQYPRGNGNFRQISFRDTHHAVAQGAADAAPGVAPGLDRVDQRFPADGGFRRFQDAHFQPFADARPLGDFLRGG